MKKNGNDFESDYIRKLHRQIIFQYLETKNKLFLPLFFVYDHLQDELVFSSFNYHYSVEICSYMSVTLFDFLGN